MEPISTTIAAITAVRGAIETAHNIKDIGSALENLFNTHHKEEKKEKTKKGKKLPRTRMQQVLRIRSGDEGYDDETSISAVANKVLEEKKKEVALKSLEREIDKKFGFGTWDEIKKQHTKLVEKKKAANKLAKKRAREKAEEDKIFWNKVLVEGFKVLIIIGVLTIIYYFLSWACKGCI